MSLRWYKGKERVFLLKKKVPVASVPTPKKREDPRGGGLRGRYVEGKKSLYLSQRSASTKGKPMCPLPEESRGNKGSIGHIPKIDNSRRNVTIERGGRGLTPACKAGVSHSRREGKP